MILETRIFGYKNLLQAKSFSKNNHLGTVTVTAKTRDLTKMSGKNIMKVIPSRMSQMQMKQRLKAAEKGHSLLKKKSDALTMRFRNILKEIQKEKEDLEKLFKKSYFSLAEAKYSAGDNVSMAVVERVRSAATRIKVKIDNVAGVGLPIFEKATVQTNDNEKGGLDSLSGISRGGEQIQKCKATYTLLLQKLIHLASLQTSFFTLDNAIRVTNRRVNALDRVVIPRMKNTISYIDLELEEISKEEFYRLKKIQGKKHKDRKAKEQALKDRLGDEAGQEMMKKLDHQQDAEVGQDFVAAAVLGGSVGGADGEEGEGADFLVEEDDVVV